MIIRYWLAIHLQITVNFITNIYPLCDLLTLIDRLTINLERSTYAYILHNLDNQIRLLIMDVLCRSVFADDEASHSLLGDE